MYTRLNSCCIDIFDFAFLCACSLLLIVFYATFKVLGTFIMEWDEGKQRANKLLASKDSVRMYADRLTELAVALGFDGWLVSLHISYVLSQYAASCFIYFLLSVVFI